MVKLGPLGKSEREALDPPRSMAATRCYLARMEEEVEDHKKSRVWWTMATR